MKSIADILQNFPLETKNDAHASAMARFHELWQRKSPDMLRERLVNMGIFKEQLWLYWSSQTVYAEVLAFYKDAVEEIFRSAVEEYGLKGVRFSVQRD